MKICGNLSKYLIKITQYTKWISTHVWMEKWSLRMDVEIMGTEEMELKKWSLTDLLCASQQVAIEVMK